MATDRDEFYRDILDGLAVYFASPLLCDILDTVSRFDDPDLATALNRNQVTGKLWLAQALAESAGTRYGSVTILGGWFGVLGAVLLNDRRLDIVRVESVDIDPRCAAVAESLNATQVRAGRFSARTADMLEIDYAEPAGPRGNVETHQRAAPGAPSPAAATAAAKAARPGEQSAPDLLINTSCEHLARFEEWYGRIPAGRLLVLQSNDYYAIAQHLNCVPDLAAFRRQAPMQALLFAGERQMKRYRRFMLIGRK